MKMFGFSEVEKAISVKTREPQVERTFFGKPSERSKVVSLPTWQALLPVAGVGGA